MNRVPRENEMENPKIRIHGVDGEEMDKYTADIELSNMCRNVYVSRLKAAEIVRKKLLETPVTENYEPQGNRDSAEHDNKPRTQRKTSIDQAMAVLKREMATLIDQDLTLMKQLLTLNEQIEELKWRRRYCSSYSRGSLASSTNFGSSVGTLSDAELDNNNTPERYLPRKYPTPSCLSVWRSDFRSNSVDTLLSVKAATLADAEKLSSSVSEMDNFNFMGSFSKTRSLQNGHEEVLSYQSYDSDHSETPTGSRSQLTIRENELKEKNDINRRSGGNDNDDSDEMDCKIHHGEQQSFDSGIHEPELMFDIEMNNVTESTRL